MRMEDLHPLIVDRHYSQSRRRSQVRQDARAGEGAGHLLLDVFCLLEGSLSSALQCLRRGLCICKLLSTLLKALLFFTIFRSCHLHFGLHLAR